MTKMKKAILMSIQPQWVQKILNGEKTIEVRKTMPKCDLPVDVYIYCTYGQSLILHNGLPYISETKRYKQPKWSTHTILNGKVVAKFTLNKIYEWKTRFFLGDFHHNINDEQLQKTCLSRMKLKNYGKQKTLYGWHIENLEILDEPFEINSTFVKNDTTYYRFYKEDYYVTDDYDVRVGDALRVGEKIYDWYPLTRPPQSWQYVWSEK